MKISFLVDKQITCFATEMIIESLGWPRRDNNLTLFELWSSPEDMSGVMLQWTVLLCWKCKLACICEPAMDSKIQHLVTIEKSQNALAKIMNHMAKITIHTTINACVYFIIFILFNLFNNLQPHFFVGSKIPFFDE